MISERDITIAVTVYNRRQYLKQAIKSALEQTVPVRVIVVEDCGPDPDLRKFVKEEFGERVEYFRNSKRRGLFDNWNACIDLCSTRYLSILHDDDYLDPEFVASMLYLIERAPNRGFYFGLTQGVDEAGENIKIASPPIRVDWRDIDLKYFCREHISFPGQLFSVDLARSLGGFRSTSIYCGDIEMWVNLTDRQGAAQVGRRVAFARHHSNWMRGTSAAERSGKLHGSLCVQQKRVFAKLRQKGEVVRFDRSDMLRNWPVSTRSLIRSASYFRKRLLRYNYQLLMDSHPPNYRYRLLRHFLRLIGPSGLKCVSQIFNFISGEEK